MYCYRQYLELKIKLITSRINHYFGFGATSYRICHDLEKLLADMEHAAEQAMGDDLYSNNSEKEASDQVHSCVMELNRIDPRGVGFRYPDEVKLFEVDPFRIKQMIREIADYLDAFHDYLTAGER